MGNWFDRLRGVSQGRIEPESVVPVDGSRIFMLGEDNPTEEVRLSTGDYTQVRQIVDLTDWDFLNATQDTIGRVTGQGIAAPDWSDEAAELFKFNFNQGLPSSENLVIPTGFPAGFTFDSVGPITYPPEVYSGADSLCRGIPAGTVVPCHLAGVHTPPVDTPLLNLDTYTLQMWVNFDFDSMPDSWGWDFTLLDFWGSSGPNSYGIALQILGVPGLGAHSWYPFLTHHNAGSSGVSMDLLYNPGTNQGWQMFTFTYDSSEPPLSRVWMYLDTAPLGNPSFSMGTIPAIPPAGVSTLQYAGQNGWGQYDSCRLLNRVLSPAEVVTSYAETTIPGPPVDTEWVQQILINQVVYAERIIQETERRRWIDFIAPVRRLDGQHEVAFRMQLREI